MGWDGEGPTFTSPPHMHPTPLHIPTPPISLTCTANLSPGPKSTSLLAMCEAVP